MQVYCTRPRGREQPPHINHVEEDYLNNGKIQQRYCSTCGMPLIIKNRYVALSEKGQGGFGRTFVALDLDSPGETLAQKRYRILKLLHPNTQLSPAALQLVERLFKEEAEVLEELRHNQIPRLYAFFELSVAAYPQSYIQDNQNFTNNEQKLFYLVQEYIQGQDLEKELLHLRSQENRNFSETEILEVLSEILGILKFIHANPKKPLIHRDIKPSNIVRNGRDKQLYLIDFGAVKQVVQVVEEGADSSETVIISPGFSPPEQVHGKTVTFTSDLYSLAASCVCLLTGANPHSFDIPFNLEKWKVSANISPKLTKVLNKMLEPDPKNRYQSADEVLTTLRREGIIEVEKSKDKIIWWWGLLGITGLGLLLTLIWLLISELQKPPLPALSAEYFTRGEKSLLTPDIPQNVKNNVNCQDAFAKKDAGMKDFGAQKYQSAEKNFEEAIQLFKKGLQSNPKTCYVDPETVIFWNNAKANNSSKAPLTIATVIPIDGKQEELRKFSEQLLRGVAHQQGNFNQVNIHQVNNSTNNSTPGLNGRLMEVVIARDNNNQEISQRVAKHIINNQIPGDTRFKGRNILAIVGNFTSKAILAGAEEYHGKIVAVSPSSTAVRQFQKTPDSDYEYKLSKYVFRIAPNDAIAAKDLSRYIKGKISQNPTNNSEKITIFFKSGEIYSKSLKESLAKKFDANDLMFCDLSQTIIRDCRNLLQNASFLMLSLGIGDANLVFSALQISKVPSLGGDALYSDDKITADSDENLNENLANKANNLVLAIPFDVEFAPQFFKEESKQLWGTQRVGWRTAATYDALQVIIDGLQRQGNNPTRQGLYDVLSSESSPFQSSGATGAIEFDNQSDRLVKPEDDDRLGVLVQVRDSKCKPEDKDDGAKYRFCPI
ncbi:bifunctional serine/threonine-protein kinase/ABC transporter substrate-binding protein [Calothrix sp. UHCC 0171]|uniref:bifunctional serine/threonine-protein kinase/ABC transporter substrate-binding protein n=1 Tax=Calothrix sp. UHCC 0171 TaxID=3110245 RepID=UPI002B1F7D28|nr:bifunctional serine/threonine-protein kinase/ABC transporter substrate-binding protein [Calothrix sp. UHCC 0171]MEA5571001.1 bifunctional serine/threonine-protein kinase/ABC transporter substrate-binding protein [Calothrix sp. UHCC 0171]